MSAAEVAPSAAVPRLAVERAPEEEAVKVAGSAPGLRTTNFDWEESELSF